MQILKNLMLQGLNAPMLSNATKAVVITQFLILWALLKIKHPKTLSTEDMPSDTPPYLVSPTANRFFAKK